MIKFYCNTCEKYVKAKDLSCKENELSGFIGRDIICSECLSRLFIIASDEEGKIGIIKGGLKGGEV